MRFDLDDLWPWIVLVVFVAGISVALYFIAQEGRREDAEHARLMAQCMADGHREYECIAMLQKPASSTVVMPMPVVIGR